MSITGRRGSRRAPALTQQPSNTPSGTAALPDPNAPPTLASVQAPLNEIFRRLFALERGVGNIASVSRASIITATGAGTFTTDANTTVCKIILQGGGGDVVAANTTQGVSGAGSGEYLEIVLALAPSTTYNLTVGAHATATTFGPVNLVTYTAAAGGNGVLNGTSGAGGGRTGGAGQVAGNPATAGVAGTNSASIGEAGDLGGSSGGGINNSGTGVGGAGGPSGSFAGGAASTSVTRPGGGGGGSSFFGQGGAGGSGGGTNGGAGGTPLAGAYGAGAGGPGAGTSVGGASAQGAQGVIIIIPL